MVILLDSLDQAFLSLGLTIFKHSRMELFHGVKEAVRRCNIRLTNIQMVDLASCLLCCIGHWCQLTNGGSGDFFCAFRNIHEPSPLQ